MLNYLIVCHISGLKSQLHEIKKKIHIHFNKIEIYNEPKKPPVHFCCCWFYSRNWYSQNPGYGLYLHEDQIMFQLFTHLSTQQMAERRVQGTGGSSKVAVASGGDGVCSSPGEDIY